MTIWIAKDWFATMVYTIAPPKLVRDGKQKEWTGYREPYLERFLTRELRNKVKMNKCLECELEISITPKK